MSSGTAFVAESDGGVTGIVLRGEGQVHFSHPPTRAGAGAVVLGRPALERRTSESGVHFA
jgi:hypothetical protein